MSAPESPESSSTKTDLLLILTVFTWGFNFSVVKFALAELSPLAFNSVRFFLAAITILVVARAFGHRWQFERRHLPFLIGLGLVGNAIYQVLFIYGAAATTADNAALILGTVPVWVALMGALAGMERVALGGWAGMLVSFAGIVLIVLGGDRDAHFEFGGATLQGDGLVLLATFCWSAYTLLVRLAMRLYRPLSVTIFVTLVGSLPLILIGIPDLLATDLAAVSFTAWVCTAFSGVFSIALAYFVWNYGISRLGSARTSLYSNIVPIVALVTAWAWLGETLTPLQGVGALAALAGVVLARRHTRPRR
ncbi:MAG: DMT family transporter [Acidobacteriota bacterium]